MTRQWQWVREFSGLTWTILFSVSPLSLSNFMKFSLLYLVKKTRSRLWDCTVLLLLLLLLLQLLQLVLLQVLAQLQLWLLLVLFQPWTPVTGYSMSLRNVLGKMLKPTFFRTSISVWVCMNGYCSWWAGGFLNGSSCHQCLNGGMLTHVVKHPGCSVRLQKPAACWSESWIQNAWCIFWHLDKTFCRMFIHILKERDRKMMQVDVGALRPTIIPTLWALSRRSVAHGLKRSAL